MAVSLPTARILPSRTASAWTSGCVGLSVSIVPPRNTKSAGVTAGGKPLMVTEVFDSGIRIPLYMPLEACGGGAAKAQAIGSNSAEERIRPASLRITHLGSEIDGIWRAVWDRKSTRLNSSHQKISYAVFCLKKK